MFCRVLVSMYHILYDIYIYTTYHILYTDTVYHTLYAMFLLFMLPFGALSLGCQDELWLPGDRVFLRVSSPGPRLGLHLEPWSTLLKSGHTYINRCRKHVYICTCVYTYTHTYIYIHMYI